MNSQLVKRRIEKLGLKKSHVAKKIGITNVMLSYYLNGKKNLSEEKSRELFKYLGL